MFDNAAVIDRMRAAGRAEAQAAAARLDSIGELFELRRAENGEQQDWAVDTWAEASAEVAAALRISVAMACSYVRYALAMRERLPRIAELFRAGDIDYRLFQTVVYRTDLVTDPRVLARVDAELALRVSRWPSMTRGRLAAGIDRVVARLDSDAVRRNSRQISDREVSIWGSESGISELHGRLFSTDATALERRLDALAATVCPCDPRTHDQRRADALGALAAGADRLGCRCAAGDCSAGKPPAGPVVIHVVAESATVAGTGVAPGVLPGAETLIPAELIAQLARSAALRPLTPPVDAAEPRYTPSAKLADFVRFRDLTCRAPGCDRPAVDCDIDHTVAFADGGATHASNLKCLCRLHHLMKTFWGWRDRQLADGTVIWDLPGGQTYVTTPGSALLFPALCAPTGAAPMLAPPGAQRCGERTAMMPRRRRTRAQDHLTRIAAERRRNHRTRLAAKAARAGPAPPQDDEPPPF